MNVNEEDTCIDCGGPNDDLEGYGGRCGNCADRHEHRLEEQKSPQVRAITNKGVTLSQRALDEIVASWLYGRCDDFVVPASEALGWPIVAFFHDDADGPDHEFGVFHYGLRSPDGRLVDASGVVTLQQLARRYDRREHLIRVIDITDENRLYHGLREVTASDFTLVRQAFPTILGSLSAANAFWGSAPIRVIEEHECDLEAVLGYMLAMRMTHVADLLDGVSKAPPLPSKSLSL